MPQGIYTNISCHMNNKTKRSEREIIEKKFKLLPHQFFISNFFLNHHFKKGLLLYHRLGSGKTCTSIYIADKMLEEKKINHVYILTPGSLRQNWIEEYCKKCGINEYMLKNYFTFITYNFNIQKQLKNYSFDKSLIIIDEIHNLINSVKNQSRNSLLLYNKIINCNNCKVLLLSGTPIKSGSNYELLLLLRLLNTDIKSLSDINLYNLKDIISYFGGQQHFFPRIQYQIPIKCKMSQFQFNKYIKNIELENKIIHFNFKYIDTFKKNFNTDLCLNEQQIFNNKNFNDTILAKLHILSRSISNFIYLSKEMEKLPDKLTKNGGWIDDKILSNQSLIIMSTKFIKLFINISLHYNSKHVIYSFFKKKHGIILISSLLTKCQISHQIISGDTSPNIKFKIIEKFNSIENRNGKLIKILLITDAAIEGLTFLEVNNLHILESSINFHCIEQLIGRIVRYKSHFLLPTHLQYVNIWRYWSVDPNNNIKCIDEILYNANQFKLNKINDFNKLLINNSI